MKYFLIILLIGLLSSCEDNKKASEVTTEIPSKKEHVPAIPKKTEEREVPPSEAQFPKLTNQNVVDFLTRYGKEHQETKARISTQYGEITLELFKDTPLHRANFVYLAKQDYFKDTFFHRVVPNFIIQGGNSDNVSTSGKRTKIGKDYLLPAEIVPGRNHSYGTVSGAKEYHDNPDKRTVPFEFFIFLGPPTSTSHLNGNYTVFAKVTKGMEIVEKIANLPADEGEWPIQNVYIQDVIME